MTETHRHTWTTTDDENVYTCTGCAEQTRACMECKAAVGTSLLICENCLKYWGRVLEELAVATSWYQWAPPSAIRATRYDKVRVHGSAAESDRSGWTIRDLPEVVESWRRMWEEAIESQSALERFGCVTRKEA